MRFASLLSARLSWERRFSVLTLALFDATPIGRPTEAKEISNALLFLSSSMSSYMCGAALVIDGGNTV
ncbi:hypothetical protein N7523_007316 [Penicillium sp. IBT 18751x]|nr:hypothetical protein N7523_007316 [Penicillium sp. IBT 18751x]